MKMAHIGSYACFIACSPVRGTVWDGLENLSFLKVLCPWRRHVTGSGNWDFKSQLSGGLPNCLHRIYSSLLLFQNHACWLFTYWLCTKTIYNPPIKFFFIRRDLVLLFLLRNRTLPKTPSFHGFLHSPLAEFNTCKRDFLVWSSVYVISVKSDLLLNIYILDL